MEHLDHVPARRGLVIFLNGTSSSGKSSIAAELLRILDEPYFHLSVDAFHSMRSRTPVPQDQLATVLHRTWQGFHRAAAGMAVAGNNVVVDHVLSAEWRLRTVCRSSCRRTSLSSKCTAARRNWSAGSASEVTGRPVWPPAG